MTRAHDDIQVIVYSREDFASRRVAFIRRLENGTFTVSISMPDGRFACKRTSTEDECCEFSDELLCEDFPIRDELKTNKSASEYNPANKEIFHKGFQWIADQLEPGDEYHLALLGNGSANVYFENVVASNDFDVINIDHDFLDEKIKHAIQGYAEENGMGRDWISDSIAVYGTASEHRSGMYQVEETIEFFGADGGYISVEMPPPESVLYRKINVGRNKDFRFCCPARGGARAVYNGRLPRVRVELSSRTRYYYEQGAMIGNRLLQNCSLPIDGMLSEYE